MIYGHPSADIFRLSNQPSFLDGLYSQLDKISITDTKDLSFVTELENIKQQHDQLVKDELVLNRYRLYDQSLYRYVVNIKWIDNDQVALAYKAVVRSLFNDVAPLICKLKLHYNRPRPFQLAALHNVALYPELSYSAQCPAFPSMHTAMGYVLANVCSNTFPPTVSLFQDLAADLAISRVQMGLCMPADIEAGKEVAKAVLKEKEFSIKYKL